MSATIQKGAFEATISDWNWTSDSTAFARMLNTQLDPEGPSGSDPAPDYHEALRVSELIGAEVTTFDLPEYVEGRVY